MLQLKRPTISDPYFVKISPKSSDQMQPTQDLRLAKDISALVHLQNTE